MAGAEETISSIYTQKPDVPETLIIGTKFLKWAKADGDESAVPVTLKVDPKGYLIYWKEPNKDTEALEISNIRDVRCGKFAKEPKDREMSKMISGSTTLGECCFTIVHGPTLVDLIFLNFVSVGANPKVVIQEWADFLLQTAYHPTTRHISVATSIEKIHTKIKLETNHLGEIPVKKLTKVLGARSNRVESALSSAGFLTGSKKTIDPEEFPLTRFKKLLQLCCPRQELDAVFSELSTGARRFRFYINQQKFKDFINTSQRDPKLNEVLYPLRTDDQALDLIQEHESNVMFVQKGQLTQDGFDTYLQSDDNLITDIKPYVLHQDMGYPLSHYFINSSHNTYLTGNQYSSRSSAEMYRQVLLSGCRCVELDCWVKDEELIINHGFTFCTPVMFKDVIEAINECAFKTSPYPVVLSFENHLESADKQAKMAQYCRDIFKEKLLIEPLSSFPIENGKPLPPPKELLYKIIIKNKKQKPIKKAAEQPDPVPEPSPIRSSTSTSRKSSTVEVATEVTKDVVSRNGARSKSTDYGVTSRALNELPPQEPPEENESPQKELNNKQLTKHKFVKMNSASVLIPSGLSTVEESIEITTPPNGEGKNCNEKSDDPVEVLVEKEETKSKDVVVGNGVGDAQIQEENGTSVEAKEKDSIPLDGEEKTDDDPASKNNEEDNGEAKAQLDVDESEEDEGDGNEEDENEEDRDEEATYQESKAYEAMSSLVNYIQPVRFKSFPVSQKHNRSHEISSFTESAALRLLTLYPLEYVEYNQRQMSRIYPKGARVDSSNYMPQLFWNAGCQFVALNFQTLDLPMQLNIGMFELNGGTGYLLKPELMRRSDRSFDPFASNIDGVVAASVKLRIISGQFLSQQKLSTYVEVDMFGLPSDTTRKMFKTKTIDGNSINPLYDSPAFVFKKIVLPSLAIMRISVSDTSGSLVGQRFLKVEGLKPGYRYITLRNESNQPLPLASLFIHLHVEDYVLETHKDVVMMLVDPIKYLPPAEREEKERREREREVRKMMMGSDKDDEKEEESDVEVKKDPEPRKLSSVGLEELDLPDPNKKENSALLPTPKRTDFTRQTFPRPGPKNKDPISEYLKKFVPQTLNDLKLHKPYNKIEKEQEKLLERLKKKHKQQFTTHYNNLYGVRTRSFIIDVLQRVPSVRRKSHRVSLDATEPIQDDESKKTELVEMVKRQLIAEKELLLHGIESYLIDFEKVVKSHQKGELKNLIEVSLKEQAGIQKRKCLDKKNKIKSIPSDLTRQEVQQRILHINEAHVSECVRDRMQLSDKQEERSKSVMKQQEEIFDGLGAEGEVRREKIEKDYAKKLNEALSICERLCDELQLRPPSTSNGLRKEGD